MRGSSGDIQALERPHDRLHTVWRHVPAIFGKVRLRIAVGDLVAGHVVDALELLHQLVDRRVQCRLRELGSNIGAKRAAEADRKRDIPKPWKFQVLKELKK